MKIRIKGNSVRLRLAKSEVEKLAIAGYLEERTSFGNNTFVYALESTPERDVLSADFDGAKITVFVPASLVKDWPENEVIGWDASIPVSDTESLYLLVEKDFKCLNESMEDQSGNFENPAKSS